MINQKRISKSIVALSLCFASLFAFAPASKAVGEIEVIMGIAEFMEFANNAYDIWQKANPDKDPSEYTGFGSSGGRGGGFSDGARGGGFSKEVYDEFVEETSATYGTTTVLPGALRVYFKPRFVHAASFHHKYYTECYFSNLESFPSVQGRYEFTSSTNYNPNYNSFDIFYEPVILPFQVSNRVFGEITQNCKSSNASLYGSSNAAGKQLYPRTGSNSSGTVPEDSLLCGDYVSTSYDRCVTVKPLRATDNSKGPAAFNFEYICYVDLYPDMDFESSREFYNLDYSTRPTSLIGDLYYGETVYKDPVIVNEGDSTYYNPVTNTTYDMTGWTYDYSDRSYHITTEDNSVTITYGDEYLTINEGDTVYNINYYVESSGNGGGTGDGGGSGGGSEKETIWDKIGNFFGTLGNGVLGIIEAAVSKVLDGLIKLAETISEKLTAVVELVLGWLDSIPLLFGGFLSFLGALFAFLPGECVLLLEFGLAAVIFIAILNAIRKR